MGSFRMVRFLPWALLGIAMFYLACWGGSHNAWWGFPTFLVGFFFAAEFLVYGVFQALRSE